MVTGPMVGKSTRRSCPGFTSFTSTPPGPSRLSPAQRASSASVPSIASTPSTSPCCTTAHCPTSTAPSARTTAMPRRDILPRPLIRRQGAELAGFRQDVADDGLGGHDLVAILLEDAHDRLQQPVIALPGGAADPQQHPGHAGIGQDGGEGGAAGAAAHDDLADPMGAELLHRMAAGADPDHDMRHGGEIGRIGPALHHHHEDLPPRGAGGGDDPVRHLARRRRSARGGRGRRRHCPSPGSSSVPPSSGAAIRPGTHQLAAPGRIADEVDDLHHQRLRRPSARRASASLAANSPGSLNSSVLATRRVRSWSRVAPRRSRPILLKPTSRAGRPKT